MKPNISVNDIAEHLQMSRTTVSKALNGRDVPQKTRERVIAAAVELGYKSYNVTYKKQAERKARKILLLSARPIINTSFFTTVIRGIESILDENKIELVQYSLISSSNRFDMRELIKRFNVDGIICFECYAPDLVDEILSLQLPTLFYDFSYNIYEERKKCDIMLPESLDSVKNTVISLIDDEKCKTFGFIGDFTHCRGFYERFLGMREGCFLRKIPYNESLCVLENLDKFMYTPKALLKVLRDFEKLPDCFVCANDYIAYALLPVLERLKAGIPGEVKILGFDNVPESHLTTPSISTFNVDKITLGKRAVYSLLERISNPDLESRLIYIKSQYIPRQTTD